MKFRRLLYDIYTGAESVHEWAPQVVSVLRDRSRSWAVKRRDVWKIIRPVVRPDWLTRHVLSVSTIRRRALAGDVPDFTERFHRLLHRFHGVRASLLLALGVTGGAVLACILIGGVLLQNSQDTPANPMATALLTTAGVLGGVAGLLFAALVFGVQFHGERLGQASFLVRYLARREGIVPIAAFTLAVVVANLFVGLLATEFMAPASLVMAALDTVLVPAVFLLAIWLIYRLVAVTSGDFFEQSLKPGLTWEYQRGLDEELHRARLLHVYDQVLRDAGIEHKLAAGLWSDRDASAIKFRLNHQGEVRDVNVDQLRSLGRLVTQSCANYQASLTIGPYDRVGTGPALVLVARRDANYRLLPVQPVASETIARIDLTLQRVFLVGVAREQEVVDLLTRFQETVIGYARYDRPDQLKRALDVYGHLIEQRLRRGVRETGPVSFSFHRLPDFLGGFGYGELAEGTVNSAEREKIDVVLIFAVRVMNLAIEYRHAELLHKAGSLVAAVYWHGHTREALQPWLGHTIDMWINHILERFHVRRIPLGHDFDEAEASAELPLLKVALAWVLGLVKVAMEANRKQDAEDFQSRIFMFDRHFDLRQPRLLGARSPAPVCVALDLHVYAMVILAGWCLYLARSCGRRTDTVKRLFRRCVADCGTRHDLVLTWERLSRRDGRGSSIDSELGVEHWHEPDRRWRSGVPQQALFARSWVPDGFVALGLVRPGARKYEVPDEMQEPPVVGYDVGAIEGAANALIGDDYTLTVLLELDEPAAQSARDQFLGLIRERVCMAKRADLTRLVNAPLSPERQHQIHRQVTEHVNDHRTMLHAIEKLGGLAEPAIASLSPPVRVRIRDPKIEFVEGEHGALNHAECLAQLIGKKEDTRLASEAERRAADLGLVSDLRGLVDSVRAAISSLQSRGYAPDLILVPYLPHVLRTLCGERWLVSPSRIEQSDGARFDGIPVIEYPYTDAESVAAVHVGSFFGKAEPTPDAQLVRLSVEDCYSVENQSLVDAAQQEADPLKIADAHRLQVSLDLQMLAGAGLRDVSAAARVRIDLQALGYAFRETEKHYHRPECAVVANASDVKYTLNSRVAAHVGKRRPCPDCKPDEWAKGPEGSQPTFPS